MDSLKVLIVEDDPNISASLNDILQALNHQVTGIAESSDQALAICRHQLPDLALLDIQLSGDLDGIALSKRLKEDFDLPFIFTTAFANNETIERAKTQEPFGYLVKPYGIKEVNAAIQIAKISIDRLKAATKKANNVSGIVNEAIFLKVENKLVNINLDDIYFIEAKGDYVLVQTTHNSLIIHSTIKNLESKLTKHCFHRVHRSYIVNIKKIQDIEENNLLVSNRIIPISKPNKESLLQRLNLI